MAEQIKKSQIKFTGNSPMELFNGVEQDLSRLSEAQEGTVRQLGAYIKAYLDAAEELLQGKYANIREWVPVHLSNPGNVLVVGSQDGVVIRFERRTDKRRIIAAWSSDSLLQLAPLLSQNLVHCYTDRDYTTTIPTTGTELKLFKEDPIAKTQENIASARIGFDAVIERPKHLPTSPHKPFCLLSVRNWLEIQVHGVLMRNEAKPSDEGQQFIARSIMCLPVGWECIEIYPFFDPAQWRSEYAPIWAENDLLAAVVAQQFREAQFQSLDTNAATRREFAAVLKSYKDLLDSDPEREEILQSFLLDHP